MNGRRIRTGLRALGWLPAAAWYVLIWSFSAQPATQSGQMSDGLLHRLLIALSPTYRLATQDVQIAALEILSFYERKAAHMFLYFVLALLIWLWLSGWLKRRGMRGGAVMALCGLLAAADEYHQTLVPGRSGELRDVLVDLAGAAIALLGLTVLMYAMRVRRARRVQMSSFWLFPIGFGVLLFFVLWKDLGLLAPFSFRVMNGGVEQFRHLCEAEKVELLRAASPVLRETLSLVGCALIGCCAAGVVLLSGLQSGFVSVAALPTVACAVIFGVAGMSPLLAVGFTGIGISFVLLAWGAYNVLYRLGNRMDF